MYKKCNLCGKENPAGSLIHSRRFGDVHPECLTERYMRVQNHLQVYKTVTKKELMAATNFFTKPLGL